MAEPRIVLIDNYDSYVFNLYQAFGELTGSEAWVVRNDRVALDELLAYAPSHVVISPGPGNPRDHRAIGVVAALFSALPAQVPVLGVCLGHQAIGHLFGATIVRAPRPVHGKTSLVRHAQHPLFAGIPSPFPAMRYHALVVERETLPAALCELAWSEDGNVMALAHRTRPLFGVQFHPESVGTPQGQRLLENFLSLR